MQSLNERNPEWKKELVDAVERIKKNERWKAYTTALVNFLAMKPAEYKAWLEDRAIEDK